jgi:hypothetical protein
MAKKTFKIGEYAKGGIIRVETTNTTAKVECVDFYTKEVLDEKTFTNEQIYDEGYNPLMKYLNDLTTSFYAEKINDFIEKNVAEVKVHQHYF